MTHTQEVEPNDEFRCPFYEFKDSEIAVEALKLGVTGKKDFTLPDLALIDEVTQPLPLQMRREVVDWMRAADIAQNLWNAEVILYDESTGGRFRSPIECQLNYGSQIAKSSFLRNLMSTCYGLEMMEDYQVEHQGEYFSFQMGIERWSARHHIYSPGVKAGGAANHKPTITKNGTYVVRLYYMGAWRRVPVSDAIPVDERRRPLLPLGEPSRRPPLSGKSSRILPPTVELWPVLIAKAVMRVAGEKYSYACDCTSPENYDTDDGFTNLDIVHSLTGWQVYRLDFQITGMTNDEIWKLTSRYVPLFEWANGDNKPLTPSTTRTVKTRSTKKVKNEKDSPRADKCKAHILAALKDTASVPRYELPGLAPSHSHRILLTMLRDIPEEKPLEEPEIPLWKTYRWYDWAKSHGLYDKFRCPRAKYISYKSLLKLSHAPQLHQVMSTESTVKSFSAFLICLIPSANYYTAATSTPPQVHHRHNTKEPRTSDYYYPCQMHSSRNEALYLHLDTAEETALYLSLETILPQIMRPYEIVSVSSDMDSPTNDYEDYLKPGMFFLERYEWMDPSLGAMLPLVFFETFGYNTGRIILPPGKHLFRIWIRSTIGYHLAAGSAMGNLCFGTRATLAERSAKLGTRLEIAIRNLGDTLTNWVRSIPSLQEAAGYGREFYRLCTPDREWDRTKIGYSKKYIPFMFQNALLKTINERFEREERDAFKLVLQKMFLNPDLGLQGQKLNSIYVTRQSAEDIHKLLDTFICDSESLELFNLNYDEYSPVYIDEAILNFLTQNILRDEQFDVVGEKLSDLDMKMQGLKEFIKRYKAAEKIQAYFKGFRSRKIFGMDSSKSKLFSEIIKMLHEKVFNNNLLVAEVLRELFTLFPDITSAFSICKELMETFKLQEFSGSIPGTFPPDIWCPLCKITFFCNAPEIQVEMDLTCDLDDFVLITFDNDTLKEIPRLSHSTMPYRFKRNQLGYTVVGYGWYSPTAQPGLETHWKLQVRSAPWQFKAINDVGPVDSLRHETFRDIYVPNHKNFIVGTIIKVQLLSYIIVRFSTSYSKVEFEVVVNEEGQGGTEVYRWRARGAAIWPIIQLHPNASTSATTYLDSDNNTNSKFQRASRRDIGMKTMHSISRPESFMSKKMTSAHGKGKKSTALSSIMFKDIKVYNLKVYVIRDSWPLTNAQWSRIMNLRCSDRSFERVFGKKLRSVSKSPPKKTAELRVGDPVFNLEIAYDPEEVISVERDMTKEQAFKALEDHWTGGDVRRKNRCKELRRNFRDKFLETPGVCSSDMSPKKETHKKKKQADKSKIILAESVKDVILYSSSDNSIRMSSKNHGRDLQNNAKLFTNIEDSNIPRFINCPTIWTDQFKPMDFIDEITITREKTLLLTPELELGMREARREAVEQYEAEQTEFNRKNLELLKNQKNRLNLIARTFVDKNWNQEVTESLDQRDQAIVEMAEEHTKMAAALKEAKKRRK